MGVSTLTLRDVAFRKSSVWLDATVVFSGALLVALLAQLRLQLPFTPVPITGQTLGVLLVGATLGARRGFLSLALYLALGVVGFPAYAGGGHGWTVLTSTTGGYLLGFVAAATLTGYVAEHRWDRHFGSAIGAMLTGNVLVYVFGIPCLAWKAHVDIATALQLGLYPFIVGDLIKVYLAAAALPRAWALVGRSAH